MNGVIIKSLSGVYMVAEPESEKLYNCKPRGIFRKENELTPLVGDKVIFTAGENDNDGTIDEILPRKNSLIRPAVANIDRLFIVVAVEQPKPNTYIIDNIIMNAENNSIEPIILINKCDIDNSLADTLEKIYSGAGFKTILVSALTGLGVDDISSLICGYTCAFTGNTGVGKSSIINNIMPQMNLETGEISKKLGRGKHTTRHIELFSCLGGYIADTPGFSSIDMKKCGFVRKENLQFCFREFEPYIGKCKFTGCSHTSEKGCAVIDAVKDGIISESRFENYKKLYEEAAQVPDWQQK